MLAASSSALAFATTVHLALAALRNHRRPTTGPISSLAVISLSLAATPWLFPSAIGLAFGFAAHLAWFIACEFLVPVRPTSVSQPLPRSTPPRPTAASAAAPPSAPRPKGFLQVPVLAAFDEAADIKTIRIARPDGFDFEAGQFIAVRVRLDGKDFSRCYSVSSAPDVKGYLEISVKRQGLVSNALHTMARPGALLSVRSPSGAFKYPSGDDRPIVLFAGGVGITPLLSMLRHAVHTEPARPVTLIYSARSEDAFAFREEVDGLARRHPQIRVHLASSAALQPGVYPGRIDEALVSATVPEIAHSICFICGPKPMIEQVKALLVRLAVPPAEIRHEAFEAAVAASAAREDAPESRTPAARAGYAMDCARSCRSVTIDPGQTLLEAAEAGGVALESLCRAGICGTCRTRVTAGDVECVSDGLSADEQRQGFVLACVARARSNCTLEV